MSSVIEAIEASQCKTDLPSFKAGDTVRVHAKIVEGEKERIQVFEGAVISRSNGSSRATFTVRKISYGVGVERIFPVHSPRIDKIEVIARGKVRRAKLYYLRGLRGKAARIKSERVQPTATRKQRRAAAKLAEESGSAPVSAAPDQTAERAT